MDLTIFDYVVFAIMGFFILLGLIKGFVREFFSLLNWIGSGLLVIILKPIISSLMMSKISNPLVASISSSIIIFIIAIIALSILTSHIANLVSTKFPSSINITLGLAFGFAKGFIISSFLFTILFSIFGNRTENIPPIWLKNSSVYKPLSLGNYLIKPFVNSILGKITNSYPSIKEESNEDTILKKSDSEKDVPNENLEKIQNLRKYPDEINFINNMIKNKKEDKPPEKQLKKETNNSDKSNANEKGGYKIEQTERLNHLIDLI